MKGLVYSCVILQLIVSSQEHVGCRCPVDLGNGCVNSGPVISVVGRLLDINVNLKFGFDDGEFDEQTEGWVEGFKLGLLDSCKVGSFDGHNEGSRLGLIGKLAF